MEKLVERLFKTKAGCKVVERPPVKPDKNRGNGGYGREYFRMQGTDLLEYIIALRNYCILRNYFILWICC